LKIVTDDNLQEIFGLSAIHLKFFDCVFTESFCCKIYKRYSTNKILMLFLWYGSHRWSRKKKEIIFVHFTKE